MSSLKSANVFDTIIVGSGPGGATLARELARAGQRVLLLERGSDERQQIDYGTYRGAMRYTDRMGLLFSNEGMQIVRPLMLGGATGMYCGCAAPPPGWLHTRYNVDIECEAAATLTELHVRPLPETLRGAASTAIAQAGRALGMDWQPQPKLMQPERAADFNCGAHCMLGCRCDAKWNAAAFVDQARAAGAIVYTGAYANRVLVSAGRASGITGSLHGSTFTAHAETVVLCAGGIGTPRILQASGMPHAGEGIAMDSTMLVYGVTKQPGNGYEPPMTWFWQYEDARIMLSTLIDPWLLYPLISGLSGWQHALSWPRWGHTIGVMIKLRDEVSGGVLLNGQISKPLTQHDREHLAAAGRLARRLLSEAGAQPASIFSTPLRGTHPSASVRIGTLLDTNLSTAINGLYVCDASAFPEALGRPTVITIIALAKRLARYLIC